MSTATRLEEGNAAVRDAESSPDPGVAHKSASRLARTRRRIAASKKVATTKKVLRALKKAGSLAKVRRRVVRRARARDPVADHLWEVYRLVPTIENRNLLVEHYRGLATSVVRRFAAKLPRRVDRGDLETAAGLGLIAAIAGFDPERGVQFESYCERRIRGALLDELRSQDWLPRPWRQRIERHKRVLESLRARRKRKPRDEEVAREMGMSLEVYGQLFGTGLPGAPAGARAGAESDAAIYDGLEVVADMRHAAPGEELTRDELLRLVSERLSPKESRIVYLKYWQGLPMREIGLDTGLSESRVCKIHAKLLERLRDRLAREG